jgi:outer membrane lipoprotein-sorting protein
MIPTLSSIPKRMTRIFFIISFLFVTANLQGFNESILDSLAKKLHTADGVFMELAIRQNQLGDEWVDTASIEILNENQFLFISNEQIIKVDIDTIFTFNNVENNVVVDRFYREDFSMFKLLAGNFEHVIVKNVKRGIKLLKLDFIIEEIEAEGSIWITKRKYLPEKITIIDVDTSIEITIESFEVLPVRNNYNAYNLNGWEIIDLRE